MKWDRTRPIGRAARLAQYLGQQTGIQVTEERFTRDELYTADEAFFTGTAAEITPIREVDNRNIGLGRPLAPV